MTVRGIVALARAALPVVFAADVVAASPRVDGPASRAVLFGLGYATAALLLVACRRRAPAEILVAAAVMLIVAWAARTLGDDVDRLGLALAGAACAVIPACLRDLDRVADGDDRVALRDLPQRRRAAPLGSGRLLPDLSRGADRPRGP